MNNIDIIAWQYWYDSQLQPIFANQPSRWTLETVGGYLQDSTTDAVAYVKVSDAALKESIRVEKASAAVVEAGVAAGTMKRVKGCVNAATGQLTLSAMGRGNILSCGNAMYLSTGDGKEIRSDCVVLSVGTNV